MARARHSDPHAALHDLADMYERSQTRDGVGRALSVFVSQSFPDAESEIGFRAVIKSAQAAGAVQLEMEKGDLSHLMRRVILRDPDCLYVFLSRPKRSDIVDEQITALMQGIEGKLSSSAQAEARSLISRIADAWSSHLAYQRLTLETSAQALEFVLAWATVVSRTHDDSRDLRTFSRQELGDSKLIERQVSRLVTEARQTGRVPEDLTDEDVSAALGLEKFPHLIEVAGDHPEITQSARGGGHVGLHPNLFEEIDIHPIRALITIENFASFNRAYRETAAPGVVFLYTGGWPGRSERSAIRHLAAGAERVLHWGDIDMAGAAIADAVWKEAGRPIDLHLMSPDIARTFGSPKRFKPIAVSETSPAYELVQWLASGDAHWLEQESLDPQALNFEGPVRVWPRSVS
jgi:hypothetical protein